MKGIDLVKAGKVMLVENWEQHGWVFITSEDQKSESRNDHDYSLNAASQNLLARLNIQAVKMFHDVVVQYLPVLEPDDGVYIVNIFLNICTCTSFVQKGQPYFCKHLHAVLATTHDCFDHLKLLELYFTAVPKIPPGLIRFFPTRNNIQGCNVFSSIKSLLQISHQATDLEKKHAVNGDIYLNSFMIQQNQQLQPSSLVGYLKDILTGQVSEGREALCVTKIVITN
jgi:hypothetical protein